MYANKSSERKTRFDENTQRVALAKSNHSTYDVAFYRTPPEYRFKELKLANTAQARKRAKQAEKQRAHNSSLRSELRTAIKKVVKAIEAGDKVAAQGVYSTSVGTLDSIADKKIIHKNKASRHKSRLSAAIKAMAWI